MKATAIKKLPKLYRVVNIKFWSLRMGIGGCGGVEEYDIQVERKARRVLCDDGWKWQLIDDKCLYFFSLHVDKDCLDDSVNVVEILN